VSIEYLKTKIAINPIIYCHLSNAIPINIKLIRLIAKTMVAVKIICQSEYDLDFPAHLLR